jgi:3-methyl-2-oxobutanoate hydroxymethyltransferase
MRTVSDFYTHKINHNKIGLVTCYDFTTARLLSTTSIDAVLVGDSVAMTIHGFKNTLSATLDMMVMHTQAVHRGADALFVVSDLPFLSYRGTRARAVANAGKLIQAGATAVKLEGAQGNLELIRYLVESGIPVMGHLGLMPQQIHMLNGYKVQGKTMDLAQKIKNQAHDLEQAGCFSIVLECIPNQLAREITQELTIATIGIGAGPDTDGQVLVMQDLLGLNTQFKPKFVKHFLSGEALTKDAIEQYLQAVRTQTFPDNEHSYVH